jgi:hypothetical protein
LQSLLPLLQQAELEIFRMALDDAARLACTGDVSAGYECLAVGLYRAQEFVEDGEQWAQDLVCLYRDGLASYSARFGQSRA